MVEAGEQRVDHRRVELGAGVGAQLVARAVLAQRLAVRAVGDERVVGVAGQDDACRERDRLAGEAVGVAAAVPALVLVADGGRDVAEPRQRAQDALADDRVLAHELPLVVVELAGLVQHVVGDADLADVVQHRDGLDLGHRPRLEPEPVRDGDRQVADGVGVLAGVAVAGLERGRQRAHDGLVGLGRAAALLLEVAQDLGEGGLAVRDALGRRQGLLAQALDSMLGRSGH